MHSTLQSFCRRGIVMVCVMVFACVFGLEAAAQTPIVHEARDSEPQ